MPRHHQQASSSGEEWDTQFYEKIYGPFAAPPPPPAPASQHLPGNRVIGAPQGRTEPSERNYSGLIPVESVDDLMPSSLDSVGSDGNDVLEGEEVLDSSDEELFWEVANEYGCQVQADKAGYEKRPDGVGYRRRNPALTRQRVPPVNRFHAPPPTTPLVDYSSASGSASPVLSEMEEEYSHANETNNHLLHLINPEGVLKIDGIMIVGSSWNIVSIDGTIAIYKNIFVKSEPASYYKGLEVATRAKFRYEMCIAEVDNASLSILITTDANTRLANGKVVPLKYNEMAAAVHSIIRNAVMGSESRTKIDFLLKGGNQMVIHEEEWESIGDAVALEMKCNDSEFTSVFPPTRAVCFLLKKFGQDQRYNSNRDCTNFPHVRQHHIDRVIIHVAVDFHLRDHLLFFNSSFWGRVGTRPTQKYNPGIFPGTGCYVYMDIPANSLNVSAIQQYTRLFHSAHRNSNEYFDKPVIAKTMLQAWSSLINGKSSWKQMPQLEKIFGDFINNMFFGSHQSLLSTEPIVTRCEFVWSKQRLSEEVISLPSLVHMAVTDCVTFRRETKCCPIRQFSMFHRDDYIPYLLNLLNVFFSKIINGASQLQSLLRSNPSLTASTSSESLMHLQDFADIYVAEGMLKRILRGTLEKFPKDWKSYVLRDHNNDGKTLLSWPFRSDKLWNQDGQLFTSVKVTDCWRDFSKLLGGSLRHADMLRSFEAYERWMKIPTTSRKADLEAASFKLFSEVSYALLQRLLAFISKTADNDLALSVLWECTAELDKPKVELADSTLLAGKLSETGVTRLSELSPVTYFLDFLKTRMLQRYHGGTTLSLALAIDNMMFVAGVPLFFNLPHRVPVVYLPSTFGGNATDRNVDIYCKAFKLKYGRVTGTLNVHVKGYLEPLVEALSKLPQDARPRKFGKMFDLINKLLDIGDAYNSTAFRKLPGVLQNALRTPSPQWIFHRPHPPNVPDHDDSNAGEQGIEDLEEPTRRVTRHSTRLEEARAFVDELIDWGGDWVQNYLYQDLQFLEFEEPANLSEEDDIPPHTNRADGVVVAGDYEGRNLSEGFLAPRSPLRVVSHGSVQVDTAYTPGTPEWVPPPAGGNSPTILSESQQSAIYPAYDDPYHYLTRQDSTEQEPYISPQYSSPDQTQADPAGSHVNTSSDSPHSAYFEQQHFSNGGILQSPEASVVNSSSVSPRYFSYSPPPPTGLCTPPPEGVHQTSNSVFGLQNAHYNFVSPRRETTPSSAGDYMSDPPTPAPSPARSTSSSERSSFSTGILFPSNRRVNTGTPYNLVRFNKPPPKTCRTQHVATGAPKPYSRKETVAIFQFLCVHDLQIFMLGILAAKLISKSGIVKRSHYSINSHIRSQLKKPAYLKRILGDDLYQQVEEARQEINASKHTHVLDRAMVKEVFGVEI